MTAALASKIQMAGIYAIQAMESAEGAVDAPAGTEAETVVHRLAAQNVRSFREHHSRLAAGCHFGSSLIQNGSQLIFARPPTLIGLGLLWSCPVLCGVARVSRLTSRRGSDPLPGRVFPFRGSDICEMWEPCRSYLRLGVATKALSRSVRVLLSKSRGTSISECEDGKQ